MTEDNTYKRLLRTPFNAVVNKIYDADPYGSYTFNRMNPKGVWRVSESLHYIVTENGWTVEEFNLRTQKDFS